MTVTAEEPPEAPIHDIDPVVYERRWAILAVLCTSLMIVIIGNTSLNVALPTLAEELNASTSALAWMVDAYALVFAGLLFTAGTLGDRFGRKGALQAGLVVFLIGTCVAALASTSAQVIAGRAIMGIAAAFVMPSTLSILTNVFPAHERPKAIAIWAGISGGGAAVGPIASGFLLEHFFWGSVFLVNVPIILLSLGIGAVLVPRSKDPEEQPLDLPGAALSIIGVGSLVYAIIEGPHRGWGSTGTIGTFVLAVVAIGAFIWRERTAAHPMLDLGLFRDRRFSVASAGITMTFFAMFGTFFLVAQYFQLVLGYSPLKSGLLQLPMAAVMMSLAPNVPKLVGRFGVHRVVPAGLLFTATGLAVFSTMQVDTPLLVLYGSILPLAAGMALTMTPLTTLIMASVPLGRAGVGSATNDTTRELGGALGVAILGSVVTSRYTHSLRSTLDSLPALGEGLRAQADSGLSGAFQAARELGTTLGDPLGAGRLVADAKQAFVDGMSAASLFGSVLVLVAAAVAWKLLPRGITGPNGPHGPVEHAEHAEPGGLGELSEATTE